MWWGVEKEEVLSELRKEYSRIHAEEHGTTCGVEKTRGVRKEYGNRISFLHKYVKCVLCMCGEWLGLANKQSILLLHTCAHAQCALDFLNARMMQFTLGMHRRAWHYMWCGMEKEEV